MGFAGGNKDYGQFLSTLAYLSALVKRSEEISFFKVTQVQLSVVIPRRFHSCIKSRVLVAMSWKS